MDTVLDWLDEQDPSTRLGALVALAVGPLALVAATTYLFPAAVPVVGALAGAALFVAGFGYWHSVLSPEAQRSTNLKARYPLKQRRGIIGAAATVWIILLLLGGQAVPAPIMGTANVAVLFALYWLWRATPTEAAEARAAYEAQQAARETAHADADDADNFGDNAIVDGHADRDR